MADLSLAWRTHTPRLLEEILNNQSCAILEKPLQIFAATLYRVAERAVELDDEELHSLMCQLTLYSCADPESPDFDAERCSELMSKYAIKEPS